MKEIVCPPNPASNIIRINTTLEIREVAICNHLGQVVIKQVSDKRTINVSELPAGFYVVEIIVEDSRRAIQKLIKQ